LLDNLTLERGNEVSEMSEQNLDVLARRIDRLDRDNKRLKTAMKVFIAAAVIVALTGEGGPTHAPKVLEAESFVLVDAKGAARAVLTSASDDNVGLRLVDAAGKVRIALEVEPDGEPYIFLSDGAEKRRIAITVNKDGSPGMSLLNGNERAVLGMSAPEKRGGGILLGDGTGKVLGAFGTDSNGFTALSLRAKDDQPRALLAVTSDSSSILKFYNKEGATVWKAP
jgi:hypothetical protein